MEFDFVLKDLVVPISLMIIFVLYKFSNTVKYFIKLIIFNVSFVVLPFFLIPYFLIRPRNVNNLLTIANIAKHVTKVLGIKWILRGEEHLSKNKSFIIVANHQSFLDVLGITYIWNVIKLLTAVSKKESIFIFPAMYLAGLVFINRNSFQGRDELNKAMKMLKKDNVKLLIFPEGTRRNSNRIHEFKKGAFYTAIHNQVPIVPLVFCSYLHFMDHEKKIFGEGKMIINALPEISTTGVKVKDIDDFMERIRQQMIKVYEETSAEVAESSNLN
ncbi:unnamed protein product [Chironomus riparius]|uniref:1-acyl-sn-glycerol-3-phosphate acyltransferase n=1 Tax=Chironomus riparius TaxID=315576 RepID=A0A9N9WPX2_9DIPT|nr:unnamed protein product [Chironomus riparius]